jgi:hypothetical protein
VGGGGRKIEESEASRRQKIETLSEKQTKAKRAGDMAEAAEHLPSMIKALNSNPSTSQRKEKKNYTRDELRSTHTHTHGH